MVDPEGRPLQETEVKASLVLEEAKELPVSPASAGETWTSAEGRFRLGGLLPGKKHDLTARKEGFAPASVVVVPAPARSVVPTEVVLKKGRLLTGRIVDAEGRPVGSAGVGVGQGIKPVQTRETGTFEIRPRGSGCTFTWSERVDLPLGALGRLGWPAAEPVVRAGYRHSLRHFAGFARTYRPE